MDLGLSLTYANTKASMREGRSSQNWMDKECDPGPGQLLTGAVCLPWQYAGGKGLLSTGRLKW